MKFNKKILSFIGIGVIGILGLVYWVANRDLYICSKGEIKKVVEKLEPIMNDWDSANNLASSTSRINLAIPVARLQDVNKELKNTKFPSCTENVINSLDTYFDKTITAYLSFMSDDYNYEEIFKEANGSLSYFSLQYNLMKEGKSTSLLETAKVANENATKVIESLGGNIDDTPTTP